MAVLSCIVYVRIRQNRVDQEDFLVRVKDDVAVDCDLCPIGFDEDKVRVKIIEVQEYQPLGLIARAEMGNQYAKQCVELANTRQQFLREELEKQKLQHPSGNT